MTFMTLIWMLMFGVGGASVVMRFPLPMGGVLLFIAILSAFAVTLVLNIVWYAYLFFVVVVGGVLVLFLYMAAISPSDGDVSWAKMIFGGLMAYWVGLWFSEMVVIQVAVKTNLLTMEVMYSHPLYILVVYLALYLLLVLLVVVRVVNKENGPLRMG